MPICIQKGMPVKELLEKENILVLERGGAIRRDMCLLKIAVLNLMPLKEEAEHHILRSLSNTPLQVDVTFVKMTSHESTHTEASHLEKFYVSFEEIKDRRFDGFIITGAPVERLQFEEVDYWEELKTIMEWTKTHVKTTLHLCWGAQAGLYYHYGMERITLDEKIFGVFKHRVLKRKTPLVRGFDDVFYVPHSRYTEVPIETIRADGRLVVLAESDRAGAFLVMTHDGSQIFVMGHPEYDRITLEKEYHGAKEAGLPIGFPENYYEDDGETKKPVLTWRANGNHLYTNWLNYYVYEMIPSDLE